MNYGFRIYRSLYWKITLPFIALIIVIMSVLGFFSAISVHNSQLEHLEAYLINEAGLIADLSVSSLTGRSDIEPDTLAKKIGKEIEARVTVISKDGTVRGDTWENPLQMENHASRPEVIAALNSGLGKSTRYSTTTRESMLYVAVPIAEEGKILGIARVALPLTTVEESVNNTVRTTVLAIVISAVVVILAAAFITRMITRPVRQLTRAAVRISSGDFDQQIKIQSRDELGQLGRAFNKMMLNLKEMMTATSDEQNKLNTVLSTIADAVIMTDSRGNILLANPAAEQLFNFKEGKALNRPLIESIINHEIEGVLKKCLTTQQKQEAQIDSFYGKYIRAIAVPLKAEKITGSLLLVQDLSTLRNLQTTRSIFIGNISHELRTPLAGIKAITETLQDGAINDPVAAADFLNRVNVEVDNLTQMVNELIDLSKIETGQAKLKLAPANLNLIIQEVANRMEPQAERKSIVIEQYLSADLPLIRVDQERIQQVVTNILHNAIKFTPEKGIIKIVSEFSDNSVKVRISDTGIGISKDDLPHIFERFFKADKSRSGKGSGLGLAIAKHIIQSHGGQVWVESREGQGSTFGFSIPLTDKI